MAQQSNLEKHVQTTIQGLIGIAISWVMYTASTTSEEVGKISVEIRYISEQINSMKVDTAASAAREHANLQRQIDDLKKRVDRSEDK